MENLGIFYDHLVYFRALGNILWPFGICCVNLVYFPRFGILHQEKSGNPAGQIVSLGLIHMNEKVTLKVSIKTSYLCTYICMYIRVSLNSDMAHT
jgi:hypothetical protein